MKRILKLRKIKNYIRPRKYINKKRILHGVLLWKKHFFQIDSPHNTNEYLINVNSAPFYNNEDDEDSINIIPNSFIKFHNDTNVVLNLFGESDITNERAIKKDDQEEGQRKIIERLFR